jgi:aminoglycoside phosphotransferase (APT) family kinase protein
MDDDIKAALRDMGLGEPLGMTALSGGVSCDVYAVDLPGRRICVKRALPKLRVAADWRAPPERAAAEVAWLRLVAGIEPNWVPKVLGEDGARHVFAMEYLPYPVWKPELAAGRVDPVLAAKVGAALRRIHAEPFDALRFDNRAQFHALRIEPYLIFTAERHPDVAGRIRAIAAGVASARLGLMHGDVSPKNILVAPHGPVFLDAETACIGDPAFDLAFCLNHLLLKAVWHPRDARALLEAFAALKNAYAPDAAFDARAAALLAALLLARIDGKSPVEYLTNEDKKDFVRGQAKTFLREENLSLDAVASRWL